MRPGWDVYFVRHAYLTATRATCLRKHVGAILVDPNHRIVASGYNGAPREMPSCDEPGVGCQLVEGHCVRTLHAESNALDFAGRFATGCTLYATVTPCWDCAKRIINANVTRVVYHEHYESRYGKSQDVPAYLRDAGVVVDRLDSDNMNAFAAVLRGLDDPSPTSVAPRNAEPVTCMVHRFVDDTCTMCGIQDD